MARRPLFPSDEEIDEIILGPDALIWQRFSDIRLFFAAGYALLRRVPAARPTARRPRRRSARDLGRPPRVHGRHGCRAAQRQRNRPEGDPNNGATRRTAAGGPDRKALAAAPDSSLAGAQDLHI